MVDVVLMVLCCLLLGISPASAAEELQTVQVSDIKMSIIPVDSKTEKFSVNFSIQKQDEVQHPFVEGDTLKFTFSLTSTVVPQQVFLSFGPHPILKQLVFIASPSTTKSTSYSVSIPSSAFKGVSGIYSISLILGDSRIQPLLVTIGSVRLDAPGYIPENEIYSALPLISHKFRVPEARPAAFTSLVFTWAVLAPLVLLVIMVFFPFFFFSFFSSLFLSFLSFLFFFFD